MRGTAKTTRMLGLRAGEVSLVKSPAVPAARFVVVKEEVQDSTQTSLDQVVHTAEITKETEKLIGEFVPVATYDAFCKSVLALFEEATQKQSEQITKAIEGFRAAAMTPDEARAILAKVEKTEVDPVVVAKDDEVKPEGDDDKGKTPVDDKPEGEEGMAHGEPCEKGDAGVDWGEQILAEAARILQSNAETAALKQLEAVIEKAKKSVDLLVQEKSDLQRSLRKAQGKDPDSDSE